MKGQIEHQQKCTPLFLWKPGHNSIKALLDHVINLSKILLRKRELWE